MPPAAPSPVMVSDRIRNLKFMQKVAPPGSPTPSNASASGSRYGGSPSSSRLSAGRDTQRSGGPTTGERQSMHSSARSDGVGNSMNESEDGDAAANGNGSTVGTEEHWTIPSSRSTSQIGFNAQAGPSTPQSQRPKLGGVRISYESSYIPFLTGEAGDGQNMALQQSVRGFHGEGNGGNEEGSDDDEYHSDEDMDTDIKPSTFLLPPSKSNYKAKANRSRPSALPSPQLVNGKFIFNPPAPPPSSKPSGPSQRPNGITAIKDDEEDDKPVDVRRNRKGQPLPMADSRRMGPPNRTPGRFEGVKSLPPRPSEVSAPEIAGGSGSGSGARKQSSGFMKPAGFDDIPSRSTPTSSSKAKKRKIDQTEVKPDPSSDEDDDSLTAGARASKKPKITQKSKVKAKKQRQKEKKRGREVKEEDDEEESDDPTDRLIDEFVKRLDDE